MHWVSERQSITARSLAKAGIHATDECVKQLQQLARIVEDLKISDLIVPKPTNIYNDNGACVKWSYSLMTKEP